MKKKIIIGSLLVVFLMMTLPSASAVESNTAEETMESPYPIVTPDIDVEELMIEYRDNPSEPLIISTLLIWFLKFIRGLVNGAIGFLKLIRSISLVIKALILFILLNRVRNTTI